MPAPSTPAPRGLEHTRRVSLGHPTAHRNAAITMVVVISVFLAPYLAILIASLLHFGPALRWILWATVALGMSIPAVRSTRPPEVTVGADGLFVRSGSKTSFIPMGQVQGVVGTEGQLEVLLKGRNKKRVFRSQTRLSLARVRALAELVDQAKRGRASAPVDAERLALLSRKGRSLHDWREALRQLAAEAASYRAMVLSREDLAGVLESADASPEHRIAAALALAEGDDLDTRARIRIAARGCAREKVRVALEGIADGKAEELALEEALAEGGRARARG